MDYINRVLNEYKEKDFNETEFLQALEEVLTRVSIIFEKHKEYEDMGILERLIEPERIIQFKVNWIDDSGKVRVNRGYRIQYNGALGPYKGGNRFDKSVNLSILKFLGFEQVFKNALTGLPIGGGKGGSDFDPKNKSDGEIMRFCQSFMTSLYRHIGENVDVPAGDIGVGSKEIGYLYGQYRRITGRSDRGVITGKGVGYGGSLIRKEATGYGLLYFVEACLKRLNKNTYGNRIIISGAGNVGIYSAIKAKHMNNKIVGMSDSKGFIVDDDIDIDTVKYLKENKLELSEYVNIKGGKYFKGSIYDYDIACDIVLPCGSQNEINIERAKRIVRNGCFLIGEGANMPNDNEAVKYYLENGVYLLPGKAANAGGVLTSALEMSQNSMRLYWSEEEVDSKLKTIMNNIHDDIINTINEYKLKENDYLSGANICAMNRVISAMIAQGDY